MNTFASAVTATGKQARVSTENGAATFNTSGSALTDLFFVIGAARNRDITQEFAKAVAENPEIATRILLYARDIRGGLGERQTFRNLFKSLSLDHQRRVLAKIPELGRFDDLLEVTEGSALREDALAIIKEALYKGNGLAAKWMPRKGPVAVELRNYLGLTPKGYRKLVVSLTKVVETAMCQKEWGAINYEHVPSVAMARYMKAFGKNDTSRFGEYIKALSKGEAKVNTSAVFPHDVVRGLRAGQADMADEMWKKLPDLVGEGSFIPMCDVSGSMMTPVSGSVQALDVSIALGMYLSERNKSAFKDIVLTFSGSPELLKTAGTLRQRYEQIARADWGMNTNLEAAFASILDHARKNRVPAADMPQTLIILSDMEFDACVGGGSPGTYQKSRWGGYGSTYQATRVTPTLYENARKQYEAAGYKMPNVVFWNLNSKQKNNPVTIRDADTALVSGFSPNIVKNVLKANLNPLQVVLDTVMVPRYDF